VVTVELRWPTWIGVVAEDLEQQRRFYRDKLGFREIESSESWAQFEIPGGGLFELIQQDPSPSTTPSATKWGSPSLISTRHVASLCIEVLRLSPRSRERSRALRTCGATFAIPRGTFSRSHSGSRVANVGMSNRGAT
jgi:catechol 2,3-dioxygenase-like lactoylglutathione lyase family enzyme